MIDYFNKENQLNYDASKILNCPKDVRKLASGAIFERIKAQMKSEKNAIIDCHATFFWKKVFENAINWHYIDNINPDMFVTIIDYEVDIKKRLSATKQWKGQKLSIEEILFWQNVEVLTTQIIAQCKNKPFYVVPRKHAKKTLFGLMFYPKVPKAYVSFPMSHLKKEESKKRIDIFAEKLQDYFLVFNPRSVELDSNFNIVQAGQTTIRDLDWFIDQVDYVITFVAEPVFTQGGSSEIKEGDENCKTVYGIFPMGYGPFEQKQCDKAFISEDELFEFLKKEKFQKLKF
ncbi:MAG: hypothetical protein KKC26_07695 [Nanoarchaeota archaeon]|nr:hypothetical protein [Nanoarchaeota archaeon]